MNQDSVSGAEVQDGDEKHTMPQYLQISTKDIPEVRARLLRKQRGVCPICKREIKDPVLDHDHSTGSVRDTLCRNCNRFEGKILQWVRTVPLERSALLRNLIRYWERHSVNKHGLIHPGKVTKRKRRRKNGTSRSRTSPRNH